MLIILAVATREGKTTYIIRVFKTFTTSSNWAERSPKLIEKMANE